jgi:hypothetical protein
MTVEDNVLPGINERLHPAKGQAVATPCVLSHLFWAVVVRIAVYFDSEPGSDQDVDPVAQIGAGLDLSGERGDSCLGISYRFRSSSAARLRLLGVAQGFSVFANGGLGSWHTKVRGPGQDGQSTPR